MNTNSDAANERLITEHTASGTDPFQDRPESEAEPPPGPQRTQLRQGQPEEGGLADAGLTGQDDRSDDPARSFGEDDYYGSVGADMAGDGEAGTPNAGEAGVASEGEAGTSGEGDAGWVRGSEAGTSGEGEAGWVRGGKADVAGEAGVAGGEETAARDGEASGFAAAHEPRDLPLDDEEPQHAVARWKEIQAGFVDDPRGAVEQANALVAEFMQRVAATLARERAGLERGQVGGQSASTEELRQSLRRYRSLFERLLAV